MTRLVNRRRLLLFAVLALGLLLVVAVVGLYRGDLPVEVLEEEYANDASRFAEILGSRVHYRDQGDGPVLVLLHGTAASLHTWDGWTRVLGDRYRILRLDLQGYGLTGPNADRDYSIDRQIAVLDELVARRRVDRLAVAGNSLGGLVAWRWAARRPDLVSHVILLAPAGAPRPATPEEDRATEPGFRTIDLARVPVLRELMTKLTPRAMIRASLEQVYGDPSKITPETVRRYYRLLRREGNRQALVDSMSRRLPSREAPGASTVPEPSDVRQPTLVQWGAEDTWIPPTNAERFAEAMPDAETIVYPGLGHVLMEEAPEPTARDAALFLESHGLESHGLESHGLESHGLESHDEPVSRTTRDEG